MARHRPHGTGSIVKAESGVYQFFWTDAQGKRHKKSLRTKNRKEAETLAKGFETAVTASDRETVLLESAKARKLIETKTLPLGDVWDAYLATNPTASAGTQDNHRRHVTRCITWLENNTSIES